MSDINSAIKYLRSDDVKMFPSSFRQSKYVEAKATSEEAFTTLKTISNNINNQNYAYEEASDSIVIYLNGYRFKIKKEKLEEQFTSLGSKKICAFIRTVENSDNENLKNRIGRTLISASTAIDIVSIKTNAGEDVDLTVDVLDTGSDNESDFLGIGFCLASNTTLLNDFNASSNYAYTILEFDASSNLISNILTIDSKNIRDVGGSDSSKNIVENFSTNQLRLNNKLLFKSDSANKLHIVTESDRSMLELTADTASAELSNSTLSIKNNSKINLNSSSFIIKNGLAAIDTGVLTVGCIKNTATSTTKTKYGALVVTGEAQISPSPLDPDNISGGNIVGNDGGESALLLSNLGSSTVLTAGLTGKAGSNVYRTCAQILYPDPDNSELTKSLNLPLEISADHFNNENSTYTRKIWTRRLRNQASDVDVPSNMSIINDWETLEDLIYPVGSIYMTTNNVDPGALFGGSWERWAQGRTIFGVDSTKDDYSTSVKTGGSYTRTLSVSNIPSHTHTHSLTHDGSHTHRISLTGGSHQHYYGAPNSISINAAPVGGNWNTGGARKAVVYVNTYQNQDESITFGIGNELDGNVGAVAPSYAATAETYASHTHTLTINTTGSGTAFNIVPPYITCYIWRRIG